MKEPEFLFLPGGSDRLGWLTDAERRGLARGMEVCLRCLVYCDLSGAHPKTVPVWVCIETVLADGTYRGRVLKHTRAPDWIPLHRDFSFSPENVTRTRVPLRDWRYAPLMTLDAVTTLRCGAGEDEIAWAYRQTPDNVEDSGWVFLSGKEPQEDLCNPDLLAKVHISCLLRVAPDVAEIVGTAPPCTFQRRSRRGRWRRVHGWKPPEE